MTDAKKQEHFCRLQLLSTRGVTPVLAKVVESICAKKCNGDVNSFLNVFKEEILILRKRKIINAAAYEVLFPQNVKTNIYAWDISLLTCILVNFCTLEGRCNKEKLIDLLKQELVIRRTDINTYLAASKSVIDQNVKKQLNDEQYKQLYPNSGITVDIKALDFEVLLIVLANCSTGVRISTLKDHLKPLLIQEIELNQFKRDLVAFLKKHYQRLTDLQNNRTISKAQYEQLFPRNAIEPDINTWDQCLLVIIVNNICPHLKHTSVNAIQALRKLRNEKLAHPGSYEITEEDFKSLWTQIITAIEIVIKNEVQGYTLQQWNDSISQIRSGPLNKEESIDIVKEWYKDRLARDEQAYKEKDETNKKLEAMHKGVKDILEILSDKKPDVYTVQEEIQCIDVKIVIKGNDDTTVKKSNYLIKQAMDAEVDKSKKDDAALLTVMKIKEVSTIKKEVTKEGSVIVAILEGSIILRMRCHTLLELHYLLRYEGTLEMKKHFDKLAAAVGLIVGDTIAINSGITDYSLKAINDKLNSICLENGIELPLLLEYEKQQSLEEITGSEIAVNQKPPKTAELTSQKEKWQSVIVTQDTYLLKAPISRVRPGMYGVSHQHVTYKDNMPNRRCTAITSFSSNSMDSGFQVTLQGKHSDSLMASSSEGDRSSSLQSLWNCSMRENIRRGLKRKQTKCDIRSTLCGSNESKSSGDSSEYMFVSGNVRENKETNDRKFRDSDSSKESGSSDGYDVVTGSNALKGHNNETDLRNSNSSNEIDCSSPYYVSDPALVPITSQAPRHSTAMGDSHSSEDSNTSVYVQLGNHQHSADEKHPEFGLGMDLQIGPMIVLDVKKLQKGHSTRNYGKRYRRSSLNDSSTESSSEGDRVSYLQSHWNSSMRDNIRHGIERQHKDSSMASSSGGDRGSYQQSLWNDSMRDKIRRGQEGQHTIPFDTITEEDSETDHVTNLQLGINNSPKYNQRPIPRQFESIQEEPSEPAVDYSATVTSICGDPIVDYSTQTSNCKQDNRVVCIVFAVVVILLFVATVAVVLYLF